MQIIERFKCDFFKCRSGHSTAVIRFFRFVYNDQNGNFRIVRGQTLTVKNELYVKAAHSLGARPLNILAKYIFPNVLPSVVIIFSVNVADAILTEAGLSFIGLGLPPDTPDWGIDLARGQDYLRRAWWLITFPGAMVSMVTLAFSMLGESLSEILNPRLSEL